MSQEQFYLNLGACLFSVGVLGVILRRNSIVMFMCVELMLNAVNLTLVAIARGFGNDEGHVFVFFIMAVAAAEAGVGLAIVLSVFRNLYSVDADDANSLRG